MLTRILITLVVFGVLFTCEKLGYLECFPWYINFVIFLIPYLLIGAISQAFDIRIAYMIIGILGGCIVLIVSFSSAFNIQESGDKPE